MNRSELREADLLTSVILACLGLAVVVGAYRMPMGGTYAGMPITWYTSPGFFPLLLGSMLVLCSAPVFVRSCRDGAPGRIGQRLKTIAAALPRSRVFRRMIVIWTLLTGYVLCLAQHTFAGLSRSLEPISNSQWTAFLAQPEGTNYVLSTFLFLASFMYLFHHRAQRHRSGMRFGILLACTLLLSWGVGYVFTQQLYSPLPW